MNWATTTYCIVVARFIELILNFTLFILQFTVVFYWLNYTNVNAQCSIVNEIFANFKLTPTSIFRLVGNS